MIVVLTAMCECVLMCRAEFLATLAASGDVDECETFTTTLVLASSVRRRHGVLLLSKY